MMIVLNHMCCALSDKKPSIVSFAKNEGAVLEESIDFDTLAFGCIIGSLIVSDSDVTDFFFTHNDTGNTWYSIFDYLSSYLKASEH